MTRLIAQAKHLVYLEIYELTDADIFSALGNARERGVTVRVLLERHPVGGSRYAQSARSRLEGMNVAVKWANENRYQFTHEKAIDVDNRIAGIFTFNLTNSGMTSNREFGVLDRSGQDATVIGRIFKADWNRRATPGLGNSDLVVSPTNSRHSLAKLIHGSNRSLDLYQEEIADPSIETALISRAHSGVRVRLLTSERSEGSKRLEEGGVSVRIEAQPYVHAKVILSDKHQLFVGSENISSTSLDHNRELGILTRDNRAIATVRSTFRADWRDNRPGQPPPGDLPLTITATPATVRRGDLMTIGGSTEPGAACTIRVTYPDGYVSRAKSLGPQSADTSGNLTWSWEVGSSSYGRSDALVTCSEGKSTGSRLTHFEIVPA